MICAPLIHTIATIFAGLLGLAFGSFLNVCLSRWPEDESIVHPRSHCRSCGHVLAWYENIPLASWLVLGGRCRQCRAWIGVRYPLVELAVGVLWAAVVWHGSPLAVAGFLPDSAVPSNLAATLGMLVFYWLLVALAVLDAEHLWLPDALTLPGLALGLLLPLTLAMAANRQLVPDASLWRALGGRIFAVLTAAALILAIRWFYWLIRHREGLGLGDAKLLAMLAAWLGLPGALLSFALGITVGAAFGVILLLTRTNARGWAAKLPFGTFLCAGGVVSSLWGPQMIAAYLKWCGF